MKRILFSLLSLFLLFGCKKSADEVEMMAVADTVAMEVPAVEAPASEETVYAAASMSRVTASALVEKPITQKIIKTGDLRFESSDLEETYQQLLAAVKKCNATIQNDSEGKNYESLYRNIIVRVPSQNFDVFLKEISKGVNYFDRKEISSQDVTEEYIDIDARLKAKKVLENRYLELLKKATKVSEMLEIETQLSAIREEIEAKEGQLRYMQSRVSMSTISVEFYKPIAQESGATISYGSKIGNAIQSGFNGISSFFIGLIELWPFIVILVAVFFVIRKRFKKKRS